MKTLIRYTITTFISLVVAIIGGYFLLADYYKDVFPYGTYINGNYCTGMTADEVNEMLAIDNAVSNAVVSIEDKEIDIDLSEIDYCVSFSDAVNAMSSSHNPYLWINKIGHENKDYCIAPVYTFEQNKLISLAKTWGISSIGEPHTVTYAIDGDNGYVICDGKLTQYSEDLVTARVSESLVAGISDIIIDEQCIIEPVYTDEDKKLFELAGKVDAISNGKFEFKLDNESVLLSKTDIVGLLEKDENGFPALDENGDFVFTIDTVYEGLNNVLSPYNSYHNHIFNTHDGKRVYLKTGNYGNEIDIKAEAELLYEALAEGKNTYSSSPEYKNKALYAGKDDIGPTYVEVALDEQKLYYYQDGKLELESDVVTGNKGRHYDTPEGVYGVFYKQRNRTLVGETYRSFVSYWIEFYPHYGLHDASWRKAGAFGGDIYLTNGSHGCVNMPTDKVARAYDIVEKGTPVIVYSYENSGIDENGNPIKVTE